MTDKPYTEKQFRADVAAVASVDQKARDSIGRAEFAGGSLEVCARLHRAYEDGKDYWWPKVKPKTMRPQSKPYAFSYFAKYLRDQAGVAPRTAYHKESAHLLVSGETFARVQKSPTSEYQIRPLGRLMKIGYGDYAIDVWAEAVKAADGEQPTQSQVAAAVKQFLDKHKAAPNRRRGPKAKPVTMQERIERRRREALASIEALIEADAYEAVQLLEAELAKAKAADDREKAAIRSALRLVNDQ